MAKKVARRTHTPKQGEKVPLGFLNLLRDACGEDRDLWQTAWLFVVAADLRGADIPLEPWSRLQARGLLRRQLVDVASTAPEWLRRYCAVGGLLVAWLIETDQPEAALGDLARGAVLLHGFGRDLTGDLRDFGALCSLVGSGVGEVLPEGGCWTAGPPDSPEDMGRWPTVGGMNVDPRLVAAVRGHVETAGKGKLVRSIATFSAAAPTCSRVTLARSLALAAAADVSPDRLGGQTNVADWWLHRMHERIERGQAEAVKAASESTRMPRSKPQKIVGDVLAANRGSYVSRPTLAKALREAGQAKAAKNVDALIRPLRNRHRWPIETAPAEDDAQGWRVPADFILRPESA